MLHSPALTRVRMLELMRLQAGLLPAGYDAHVLLLGGGAMLIHRLRASTRDIDALFGARSPYGQPRPLADSAVTHENSTLHITAQRAITTFNQMHPRLQLSRRAINEDMAGDGILPRVIGIDPQASIIMRGTYDRRTGKRGHLFLNVPTLDSLLATKLNELRVPGEHPDVAEGQDADDINALLQAQHIPQDDAAYVLRHLVDVTRRHFAPEHYVSGPQRYAALMVGLDPARVEPARVSTLVKQDPYMLVAQMRRVR